MYEQGQGAGGGIEDWQYYRDRIIHLNRRQNARTELQPGYEVGRKVESGARVPLAYFMIVD
jgi:hypothetical protein